MPRFLLVPRPSSSSSQNKLHRLIQYKRSLHGSGSTAPTSQWRQTSDSTPVVRSTFSGLGSMGSARRQVPSPLTLCPNSPAGRSLSLPSRNEHEGFCGRPWRGGLSHLSRLAEAPVPDENASKSTLPRNTTCRPSSHPTAEA